MLPRKIPSIWRNAVARGAIVAAIALVTTGCNEPSRRQPSPVAHPTSDVAQASSEAAAEAAVERDARIAVLERRVTALEQQVIVLRTGGSDIDQALRADRAAVLQNMSDVPPTP